MSVRLDQRTCLQDKVYAPKTYLLQVEVVLLNHGREVIEGKEEQKADCQHISPQNFQLRRPTHLAQIQDLIREVGVGQRECLVVDFCHC